MKKNIVKNLSLLFPLLYLIEGFLGFNGRIIMIGGLSLRMILFAAACLSVYGYLLVYLIQTKTPLFGFKQKNGFVGSFTLADWALAALLVSIAVFAVIVPHFKGTSLAYAIDEVKCTAVLVLYFPVAFMARRGEYSLKKLETATELLVILLGVCHMVFYIGEKLHTGFIEQAFAFLIRMFGGSGEMPAIIFGVGYIRVIYTTSVLLIFGFYFFFRHIDRVKPVDYVCLFITALAALSTVTKGLWLGMAGGIAIFVIAYCIVKLRQRDKKSVLRLMVSLLICLAVVFVSDFTIFDRTVSIRLKNFFVTSVEEEPKNPEPTSVPSNNELVQNSDKLAAAESNSLKIDQMKALLGKWSDSKLFGYGFGAYEENCIRSADAPYSYEMTAFALLMKIGIAGILVWAFFFLCLIYKKYKLCYKTNKTEFWSWLSTLVAFGLAVQTNPYLFNFVGISILLLLALISSEQTERPENACLSEAADA